MARTRSNFRQSDATRAMRAAVSAGLKVQRVDFHRDGRISIIAGGAETATTDDLDRELAEFEARDGKG